MILPSMRKYSATQKRLSAPLVLLPGWGFDEAVWQPLLPYLQTWANVESLSLEVGTSGPDEYCAELAKVLPEHCVLLGWSLGGMLATRLVALYPERIRGLITLATNASFVARPHWPDAMAPEVFEQFYQRVSNNPQRGLKRFCQLVAKGGARASEQLPWLERCLLEQQAEPHLSGLDFLAAIDNSALLDKITCPSLHILGGGDALVPVAAAEVMKQKIKSLQSLQVLTSAGHLLHSPSEAVIPKLDGFFTGCLDGSLDFGGVTG